MRTKIKSKKLWMVVMMSVGMAMLTACGGNSVSKDKVIEPSEIITKEEATQLLGVEVGEGVTTDTPLVGEKLCVYEKEEAFLQVTLSQESFMSEGSVKNGITPKNIFEETKAAFSDAKQFEGLGDDNFIAPPGVHILKGDYYITISFGFISKDATEAKLQEAGLLAVENLVRIAGSDISE